MNPWQVARQLANLLEARTWPDGAGEVVFSQVAVTAAPTEQAVLSLRAPFAILRPLDADADPEAPDLLTQRFELSLCVMVAGDDVGQVALLGGARSAGQGSSRGRGLHEVEEQALAAVEKVLETSGVRLLSRAAGATEGAFLEGVGYAATRAWRLEARCTRARYYHPARAFTATAAGGGNVALAWSLPPARFDRYEVRLRRASGATAPASVTAGTAVTLSGLLATSVTDAPGTGQFSYALFAGYDEKGASASDRWSASVTRTVTAT